MGDTTPTPVANNPQFYPGAHEFTIENQINIGSQNVAASRNLGLPDSLAPIPHASHTRNRKRSPPDSSCLPGTRKELISKITTWASSSILWNKKKHVMWLYGYVGCGKSSLAQAVAEELAERRKLAASFFFFRGSGDRSTTTKFAATIASQVAAAIPSAAPLTEAALKAEVGLLERGVTLSSQFQKLVYEPIKATTSKDELSDFIDHMITFFKKNPSVPLRFLISSRVEEYIRDRLHTDGVEEINLVNHTTLQDIAIALEIAFASAAAHNRVLRSYGKWPTPSDQRKLVEHTGGSFIFMSTIIKFILGPAEDGLTPFERLPMALNTNPGLDGLYMQTLSRAQHFPHFQFIVWTIALLQEPLSTIQLADLLDVPGDDYTPVTMCHSSLQEFLTTERRSMVFCAPISHHAWLARRCLSIHHDLGHNPAYEYAKRYWVHHFEHANDELAPDEIYTSILAFVSNELHFLDVIWTIALLQKPLTLIQIARILSIEHYAPVGVRNIFLLRGKQQNVHCCHASLVRYLTTEERSGSFYATPIHHKCIAYGLIGILGLEGLPKPDESDSLIDYARGYGEYHWAKYIHYRVTSPGLDVHAQLEEKRNETQSFCSHFGGYLPHSFPLILASTILMDLKDARIRTYTARSTPKADEAILLARFLEPRIPIDLTLVIMRALQTIWGSRNSHTLQELQLVWDKLNAALPPLQSFHYQLVAVANMHFLGRIVLQTEETFAYSLPGSTDGHFSLQGMSPEVLDLVCFMWAKQLVLALDGERSPSPTEYNSLVAFWYPKLDANGNVEETPMPNSSILVDLLSFLQQDSASSLQYKESFVKNKRLAVEALRNVMTPDEERMLMQKSRWRWVEHRPGKWQFRLVVAPDIMPTMWSTLEVLSAFMQLVECLERRCEHGPCPVKDLLRAVSDK